MAEPSDVSNDYSEQLARQLDQAVEDGDINRVKDLLGQGANPNHQLYWSEEWGWKKPPLHRACVRGYLEIVKILVNAGAAIDKPDRWDMMTPLHWACREGHLQLVVYLIREAGCRVDVRDKDNRTPLHVACVYGRKDVVQYLVEEVKCDVGVRDDKGRSPLDCALKGVYYKGCLNTAHYLIIRGCGGDKERGELLCGACGWGNLDMVKELIEQHKVDPNTVQDESGESPLDIVMEYIEVAGYPDEDGDGPPDALGVARYLISRGCGGDKEREKLLCGACYWDKLDMVKELVEQHKVDPNNVSSGYRNRSPLHCACVGGRKQVVQYLVERAHCDVNVTDHDGDTPLDLATRRSTNTWADQDERKRCTEVVDYLKSLPPEHSDGQKRVSSENHERRSPPAKRPRTQNGSQPQTRRECPTCGESCHIRYKSCPHCEHQFPSSSKSRAKPDQEPKKNPANLLQIIQKKIDQLSQVGYDIVVLVHTDSSKSHEPNSSSRTRHTYRKYFSPGLADSFLESPLLYNSWKEHCNPQTSKTTGHVQNGKTTERASRSRRGRGRKTVGSRSGGESHDQESVSHDGECGSQDQVSRSHDQGEGSHAGNGPVTRRSLSHQESSTGTLSNRQRSPHTPSDSAHNQPHHMNTVLSGPAQPAHNSTMSASSFSTSAHQPGPSATNPQQYNFLSPSNPFSTRPPLILPIQPSAIPALLSLPLPLLSSKTSQHLLSTSWTRTSQTTVAWATSKH